MNDPIVARRARRIRTCTWLSFGSIAAGILVGGLFSVGQDLAGADLAWSLGILAALLIALPASVVAIWSAGRGWGDLDTRHRALVLILMVFVLAPIVAFAISVGTELAEPADYGTLEIPE